MSVWLLIGIVAILACAALIYSGRTSRVKDDLTDESAPNEEHFKVQLAEISADVESGRLDEQGAGAARAELARELLHHRKKRANSETPAALTWLGVGLPLASVATIVLAVIVYGFIGLPDQPSAPLGSRTFQEGSPQAIKQAILQVEAQLVNTPDDLNGWLALAPAYMQVSRFQDAADAYRRILDLSDATPDKLTDLAQAILFTDQGVASPAALELLQQAAQMDPGHARSRFYLAGDATRRGDWDNAVVKWNELLALSAGDEPWLEVARNGLAVAMARGVPETEAPAVDSPALDDPAQLELIRSMVARLAGRIEQEGGTGAEWTRLVRSYLVLGETGNAQTAYGNALATGLTANERTELDDLAAQAGLTGEVN